MQIIKDVEKRAHQAGDSTVVYEYETADPTLGGATALIPTGFTHFLSHLPRANLL